MFKLFKVLLLAVVIHMAWGPGAFGQDGQPWYLRGRLDGAYDLKGTRILVVAGAQFNPGETMEMAECWKRWGARVEFAGPTRVLTGEQETTAGAPSPVAQPTLRVDRLLTEVDPSSFDVLYVAGGEGIPELFAAHRDALARLIDAAHARGAIVSAICHGPHALAASTAVKGRRVTAQGAPARTELERAGAILVNEIVVVDGAVVTGQWPHLEEFAVALAERVCFPAGGGPREKALASRTVVERNVDDLRETFGFDNNRPVPAAALEALARAGQRALAPRGSNAAGATRMVAVQQPALKADLAALLSEKAKTGLIAMGMPEALVRPQVGRMFQGPPVLLFQFVKAPAGAPGQQVAPALRSGIAFAGAAAANMALVARSLELGVLMLGIEPFLASEDAIRHLLRVPETELLVGIYGIGYPAPAATATPAPAKPAAEVVFTEYWGRPLGRLR